VSEIRVSTCVRSCTIVTPPSITLLIAYARRHACDIGHKALMPYINKTCFDGLLQQFLCVADVQHNLLCLNKRIVRQT
jgi:hypothetical protein